MSSFFAGKILLCWTRYGWANRCRGSNSHDTALKTSRVPSKRESLRLLRVPTMKLGRRRLRPLPESRATIDSYPAYKGFAAWCWRSTQQHSRWLLKSLHSPTVVTLTPSFNFQLLFTMTTDSDVLIYALYNIRISNIDPLREGIWCWLMKRC
jgi:hypothetical protein